MNILRQYKIYKITGKLPEGKEGEAISFIKGILNDIIPFKHEKYPNSIFYMNRKGEWIFEQDNRRNEFYVRYSTVWSILQNIYSIKYIDIQEFIKYMIEDIFKQKIAERLIAKEVFVVKVEDAFKHKVSTPTNLHTRFQTIVEKDFKKLNNI